MPLYTGTKTMPPMTTPTDQTDRTGTPFAESKAQYAPPPPTDEIFITPRVLDAAAFDRYTQSLQALIRDLDQRSTRLSSTSADTSKLCTVLRQAAKQLETRATAGAALAKRLESQTAQAETVTRRFTEQLGSEAELTRLAESAASRKRAEIASAMESALAGLDAKLTDGIEQANQRASQAEARATAAEQKLDELSARLDAVTQQADTIAARASEAVQAAEASAERATANAIEATEQLRLVADSIAKAASTDAAALEQRLGPFRDLVQNAAAILGTPEAPGTLATAIETAESRHEALTKSNAQANAKLAAAEEARANIAGAITAAAECFDTLAQRKASLTASVESDIESLSDELSPIEHTAAALRRTIDDLVARTQSLHAEISSAAESTRDQPSDQPGDAQLTDFTRATESITQRALTQVEQAAKWLESLAAQAQSLSD